MIVSRFQELVGRTYFIRERPVVAHAVAVGLVALALEARFVIGDVLIGYPEANQWMGDR
jgi:hypothetical protein